MFVLTIDRRDSRSHDDTLIESTMAAISDEWGNSLAIPVARFAGDELQVVTETAAVAIDIILYLARGGNWRIGLGHGDATLAASPGASTGPAFFAARDAITRAKRRREQLALAGADPRLADVEALLGLLTDLRARRTAQGWEVADLLVTLQTQRAVAAELGVTASAISERAATAGLKVDDAGVRAAHRMLTVIAADAAASVAADTLAP